MQVFVTPRAVRNFDSIVDYITDKWGEGTAKQFVLKTDEIFKLLQNYPTMGPIENGDIRAFNSHARQGCFIGIRDEKIIVLTFIDTRHDPNKKFH